MSNETNTDERDSMIVYRTFYESIRELPKTNQAEVWEAVFELGFNFNEMQLKGLSQTVFRLMVPVIRKNIAQYTNGKKPKDRPKQNQEQAKEKPNASQHEANGKPIESQTEAYKDEDKDKDKDKDKDHSFDGSINLSNEVSEFMTIYGSAQKREATEGAFLKAWQRLTQNGGGFNYPPKTAISIIHQKAAEYRTFCMISKQIQQHAPRWLNEAGYLTDWHQEKENFKATQETAKGGRTNGKSTHNDEARSYGNAAIDFKNAIESQFED